jgi:hypothetical protein
LLGDSSAAQCTTNIHSSHVTIIVIPFVYRPTNIRPSSPPPDTTTQTRRNTLLHYKTRAPAGSSTPFLGPKPSI